MLSGNIGEAFNMFRICTKKSLIVSAALVLAIVCTGVVAASAHTKIPVKQQVTTPPQSAGIPAIPPPRGPNGLLSVLDVVRYLDGRGFIGGPALNGGNLGIQNLHLTTAGTLNNLEHIFIPGVPQNEKVYYTKLKGPFTLPPNVPRSTLSTLLPGKNNVLPLRALLPTVGQTLGLNNSNNSGLLGSLFGPKDPPSETSSPQTGQSNTPNGSQPASNKLNTTPKGTQQNSSKLITNKAPTTSNSTKGSTTSQGKSTGSSAPRSLGKLPTTRPSSLGTILQNVYEVFDAHTGNLLAWG